METPAKDTESNQAEPTQKAEPTFDQVLRRFEIELLVPETPPDADLVIELIDELGRILKTRGLREHSITEATVENRYTRIAAALGKVATHPEMRISHRQLQKICLRKQTIAYIFNASGYRNMSHLLTLAADDVDGELKLNLARAATLLAFLGIEDVTDQMMSICLRQPPRVLMTLMLGWLNQRAVLTEQGEKNRTVLLESGALIEDVEIEDREIPQIVNAYMYCSYASSPEKHAIKRSFNRLMKARMNRASINPKPMKRKITDRPRMLVCGERFTRAHAMYRCFGPHIKAFSKHFELISLTDHEWIDDEAAQLFDEVVKLESPRQSIQDIASLIQKLRPDLIYYPSLGMSHWTVMISNLRLAPIQLMGYGHPGTSMSTQIDYGLPGGFEGSVEQVFSEKIIIPGKRVIFDQHPDLPDELPQLVKPSDREVRVAVNSKVMKLSHRLIDICRRLTDQAEVQVRFSFFPGERGLYFDGLYAAIKRVLPAADVMPYVGYQEFLNEMCKCDLALASFPFGNANSTVDTCLLGLPTLAHYGPELHSQSDQQVLSAAGYSDWLIARSDEEYFEKALKLINSADFRRGVSEGITRDATKAKLFYSFENDDPGPAELCAEAVSYIYQHHDQLRNSKERHVEMPPKY